MDDEGNELIVAPGVSASGNTGWFIAVRQAASGDEPDQEIRLFFYMGENARENAIRDAKNNKFHGFPDPTVAP